MRRAMLIPICFLVFCVNGASGKKIHDFPEQGTIVAVHSVDTTHVYTANLSGYDGKMHPRTMSSRGSYLVYRIETKTMFYEVAGSLEKDGHNLGSSVAFRFEKNYICIQDYKGRERKYRIEGKELEK